MRKIKVAEAIGPVLNWMVAKCENPEADDEDLVFHVTNDKPLNYSRDWAQGGPIIEREKIEVRWIISDSDGGGHWWTQNLFTDTYSYTGPSLLIAAMRCFVASRLGDVVNVPEEMK